MKKCIRCGYSSEEDVNFCPECGYKMTELKIENKEESGDTKSENKTCSKCGKVIENSEAAFCIYCGAPLNGENNTVTENSNQKSDFISSVKSDFKKSETVNQMGNMFSSFKKDLNNSQTINQVKAKAGMLTQTQKNNIKIAAIVVAVLVLMFIILSNIHTCEECEKVYFGKENTISFFGESESVCKDCYNDFYSFY